MCMHSHGALLSLNSPSPRHCTARIPLSPSLHRVQTTPPPERRTQMLHSKVHTPVTVYKDHARTMLFMHTKSLLLPADELHKPH